MTKKNRICLGAVAGVHGIKGEVKVKSFTEVDSDLDKYGLVENEAGDRRFELKVVGHSKELLRVKIKGVDDRNEAEKLIGTAFFVDRSVLPELSKEDEYYEADLIGLDVKTPQNSETAGTVAGLYNFGAGEILEIKVKATGKLEMIPFNQQYVPEVNVKDGYIIVESVLLNFMEDEEDGEGDEG